MLTNYDITESAVDLGIPFNGCFSKDQLPPEAKHGGYIINLMDSDDGFGSHWVALAILKNKALYFDSFGFPPPTDVMDFYNHELLWNPKEIQNIRSGVCGSYCLAFLWWTLVKGQTMETFVKQFSDDVTENRQILQEILAPL